MGEARRQFLAGTVKDVTNGKARPRPTAPKVPLVRGIRLENDREHSVVVLSLGDTADRPILAVALDANEARNVAMQLLKHAEDLPMIINPNQATGQ